MKKALAGLALLAMTSTGALAQEAGPLYSWGGLYGGVTLGYGFGDAEQSSTFGPTQNTEDMDGVVGGIVAGYNFQKENLVFGFEVDASLSDISGSSGPAAGKTCFVGTNGCNQQIEKMFTARARVGYAFNNVMPFLTAGVALADVVEDTNTPGTDIADWETGFVFGGGIEVAGDNNWRFRAEYLGTNLSSSSNTVAGFVSTNDVETVHVFRVGITRVF